jgi:hypothetical protein
MKRLKAVLLVLAGVVGTAGTASASTTTTTAQPMSVRLGSWFYTVQGYIAQLNSQASDIVFTFSINQTVPVCSKLETNATTYQAQDQAPSAAVQRVWNSGLSDLTSLAVACKAHAAAGAAGSYKGMATHYHAELEAFEGWEAVVLSLVRTAAALPA